MSPEDDVLSSILDEVRKTNQLLILAFSTSIAARIGALSRTAAHRAVIAALSDGEERTTDAVIESARRAGSSRTATFEALSELQRGGVLERPRRGAIAITAAAKPFITVVGRTKAEAE